MLLLVELIQFDNPFLAYLQSTLNSFLIKKFSWYSFILIT